MVTLSRMVFVCIVCGLLAVSKLEAVIHSSWLSPALLGLLVLAATSLMFTCWARQQGGEAATFHSKRGAKRDVNESFCRMTCAFLNCRCSEFQASVFYTDPGQRRRISFFKYPDNTS